MQGRGICLSNGKILFLPFFINVPTALEFAELEFHRKQVYPGLDSNNLVQPSYFRMYKQQIQERTGPTETNQDCSMLIKNYPPQETDLIFLTAL